MRTILIIDDEKDFCFFLKQNLELTGRYKVVIATNSKDGIAAASRERPELIFLDIMMPVMSGFEVLKVLKDTDETMRIPVVMLTAIGTQEAKERAIGLFDEDYIVKPVQVSMLLAKIEEVLSRGKR